MGETAREVLQVVAGVVMIFGLLLLIPLVL